MIIYLNFSLLGWLSLSIILSPLEYYASFWLSFILPVMYYLKEIMTYILEWDMLTPSFYFIKSVMYFQRWFDLYVYYAMGKRVALMVADLLELNWYDKNFLNYMLTLKNMSYVRFYWHLMNLLMLVLFIIM